MTEGLKKYYDMGALKWPGLPEQEVNPEHDKEVLRFSADIPVIMKGTKVIMEKAMNFGDAIEQLKLGHRVTREGWNGKDMYLELQVPDANSKMTLPYIFMFTAQCDLVPWLASQTDILSSDWSVLTK